MHDDIIIGKKNHNQNICSAVHCFEVKGDHGISENKYEYWINGLIFNTYVKIYKDCKEGQRLTTMIKNKKELSIIIKYLNTLVLKHLSVDKMLASIKNYGEEMFEKGKKAKQKEIKNVLGL